MKPETRTRIIDGIKIYITGSVSMLVVLLIYGTDLFRAVCYLVIGTIGVFVFIIVMIAYIFLIDNIKKYFHNRHSKGKK
ncbi:MAG TPA: hypothetical protein PK613_22550 [Anaerolineaceae bacterium]|nr:hypothetical protein [Anaerolineaceae bacterium]